MADKLDDELIGIKPRLPSIDLILEIRKQRAAIRNKIKILKDKEERPELMFLSIINDLTKLNNMLIDEYMGLTLTVKEQLVSRHDIPEGALKQVIFGAAISIFYEDAKSRGAAYLYAPMAKIENFIDRLQQGEKRDTLKL